MVGAIGHTARGRAIDAGVAIAAGALATLTDAVVVTVAGAIGNGAVVALPAADALANAASSAVSVTVAVIGTCGGATHLASPALVANAALGVIDGTDAVTRTRHNLAVGASETLVATAARAFHVEIAMPMTVH
jgi:hypothetical protein